ncbi:MAG: hypothetical protein ACT4QA_23280 [Panacagrimonas sp.]
MFKFKHHALAALVLAALPLVGNAGVGLVDPRNTSTGINSSSVAIRGNYVVDFNNHSLPWVSPVFVGSGECLRIDVTTQNSDLEAVFVDAAGNIFRNDDRGGSGSNFLFPLLKISSAARGWGTLHITHFAGGGINGEFVFNLGRYNSGNPNCATPTAPSFSADPQAAERRTQKQYLHSLQQ